MPVFNTPLGKLGAVICWENYMPLLRMTMYAEGIALYCVPYGRRSRYMAVDDPTRCARGSLLRPDRVSASASR